MVRSTMTIIELVRRYEKIVKVIYFICKWSLYSAYIKTTLNSDAFVIYEVLSKFWWYNICNRTGKWHTIATRWYQIYMLFFWRLIIVKWTITHLTIVINEWKNIYCVITRRISMKLNCKIITPTQVIYKCTFAYFT